MIYAWICYVCCPNWFYSRLQISRRARELSCNVYIYVYVCVCVCVCGVCLCVCMCVCACVWCVCVCVCVCCVCVCVRGVCLCVCMCACACVWCCRLCVCVRVFWFLRISTSGYKSEDTQSSAALLAKLSGFTATFIYVIYAWVRLTCFLIFENLY